MTNAYARKIVFLALWRP